MALFQNAVLKKYLGLVDNPVIDREIDAMVHLLYWLSEEKVRVVVKRGR
jgi:hypothetical protein